MSSNLKKSAALTLALTMLAGCGGSGAGSSASAASGSTDGAGKPIVVATDTDLNTMDHEIATDGTSFVMQSLCYSGLMELAKDGSPVADLAKSVDVSEDGLTYTFHLVDENWSNGTPVTAKDFVYGWQRLVNPDTASEYAFILDTMHVVNAGDCMTGAKPVTDLGVEAVDDSTFVVHLTSPCDFFLGLMAFPSTFPLNQEFYESKGDQFSLSPEDMIYCGPFTMSDWKTGNEYTFVKNADYWNADAIATPQITFKFIQDTQSAMLDYQSGNIDVVKLQGEQVDAYKDQDGFTNRLTGYLWYLSLNFQSPDNSKAISNLNLRKALSLAIDRDTLCENVLKDGSVAATGIIPQALATGPDKKDFADENTDIVKYDAAAAGEYYKKAVEELGGDVTLTLLFEDSEASKAVAEKLQSDFETNCPGLSIELDSKPKKTRLSLMNAQDYDIGLTRWGPDYADPETYMDLYVSGNEANNSGRYNNADYDKLVEAGSSGADAADSEKRWQDYIDAERILVDEDPGVIPVYQNGGAMMINPAVTGIEFHSAGVDSYRHAVKA